ncbi:mediator of RNA polymerase II transcription subunit 30 [Tribolium castaneum]|uniref:Mediator of RNA polymerase II transcription subunit 30 n=1 Tax=Tribolium castaneum TaxID=7070 RepID=D6WVC4_TRICA|nr:PREDICTED: mediator of RNA polymerase II transcription subunit 30 [Tribolium castaneum]EFA08543.1 Mediator of RNA polymerase II transcription subunit 30-like Protein [Tribolium castaneum]|eukprot:XP_968378.1 PREDICTED: mediator of RNA polymerase II transcription subunit 30 [Tribolium castaneum]
MSAPQHHFMQGLNNSQQTALRNQFASTMQSQMGTTMQNQLPVHMGNQMNNPMMSQMASTLNNPTMPNSQIMGQLNQQYAMNPANQIAQHQGGNMQMQQGSMEFSNNLQHHAMQANQAQMVQQGGAVAPAPQIQAQQQQQQQSKEFNTASLCRIGQETVQDIVSRTQEVFQTLKTIQPPNGTPQSSNASNEKKAKVQEQLRTIRVLFKRLRLIYEKCNENCQLQGMEYTHIESLIPFKDEHDPKHDEKKNSEAYRLACEECKEVMEQVILKNKQLKDVIDHLRRIIWEINTMLTMRRS